jgi:SAM-dependent methyltransferase
LIEGRFGRKLDVLYVGAGCRKFVGVGELNRRYCEVMENVARSYVALEPSWDMIRQGLRAGSRFHHLTDARYVRGVGEAIPLGGDSVDLVIVKASLDHCVDASAVLREIHRVLRPGGGTVISLQNFESWHRRVVRGLMPGRYRQHRANDHHACLFDPERARAAAVDAGLTVESCVEMGYADLCRYTGAGVEKVIAWIPALVGAESGLDRMVRWIDGLGTRIASGAGARFVLVASKH